MLVRKHRETRNTRGSPYSFLKIPGSSGASRQGALGSQGITFVRPNPEEEWADFSTVGELARAMSAPKPRPSEMHECRHKEGPESPSN